MLSLVQPLWQYAIITLLQKRKIVQLLLLHILVPLIFGYTCKFVSKQLHVFVNLIATYLFYIASLFFLSPCSCILQYKYIIVKALLQVLLQLKLERKDLSKLHLCKQHWLVTHIPFDDINPPTTKLLPTKCIQYISQYTLKQISVRPNLKISSPQGLPYPNLHFSQISTFCYLGLRTQSYVVGLNPYKSYHRNYY